MTQHETDQIIDWMAADGNIQKLSLLEAAQVNLYFQEYMAKIAPIITRAMAKDEKTTFLFKLDK